MANYNKSFSFRNGVQVDEDALVVRNSLVGINTQIPTEVLDVYGTAKITGVTTTQSLYVQETSTLGNVNIGTGIKLQKTTGIITATAFYGNGATLSNLPTSQWIDVDVGLGFTSIYAQGNVGVSTSDPRFRFQVGGNPNSGSAGVGIDSTGNIRASGIITATSFVGVGSLITNINASNITSGTILNDYLPAIDIAKLPTNPSFTTVTATDKFIGGLVGIASTARGLTGSPNITVTKINSVSIDSTDATIGINTVSTELNVGIGGTAITALNNGRIGIGTAIPGSELQIYKNTNSLVEIVSESGQARLSIGQVTGVGNSTGVVRFGSLVKSLDFINNDTGNLSFYLHSGSAGINTGRFAWIYGQSNSERMSLTYDGRLGLGITNPVNTFHVVGTSTVTNNSYVGGNLEVAGSLTVGINANKLILGSGASQILNNVNVSTNSGITTLSQLHITNAALVGINTDKPDVNYVMDAQGSIKVTGIVTATTFIGNFVSPASSATPVEITVSGGRIIFTVAGVGATSFALA